MEPIYWQSQLYRFLLYCQKKSEEKKLKMGNTNRKNMENKSFIPTFKKLSMKNYFPEIM